MMLGDITGTDPVCLTSVRTRRPTLGVLYSVAEKSETLCETAKLVRVHHLRWVAKSLFLAF
jgi:hypothetical protein